MAKIAFPYFVQKVGKINADINELIDEIHDFLDNEDVGDWGYVNWLHDYLYDIEAMWLEIYNMEDEYNSSTEDIK